MATKKQIYVICGPGGLYWGFLDEIFSHEIISRYFTDHSCRLSYHRALNLQGLFNGQDGQLEHTEYLNQKPDVLRLLAFVGRRDGGFSVMYGIIKI